MKVTWVKNNGVDVKDSTVDEWGEANLERVKRLGDGAWSTTASGNRLCVAMLHDDGTVHVFDCKVLREAVVRP